MRDDKDKIHDSLLPMKFESAPEDVGSASLDHRQESQNNSIQNQVFEFIFEGDKTLYQLEDCTMNFEGHQANNDTALAETDGKQDFISFE